MQLPCCIADVTTSESWNLSGNFTFGKACCERRRAGSKTTEKGDDVIWHRCKSTPKSSLPPNKRTLGCPVCEKKTASTTAGQTAVAFPVWFTPCPKSNVADLLPGKTGSQKYTHPTP